MFDISVSDIVAATGAQALACADGCVATNVATDSRQVGEGTVFVCFRGERVDGNRFAPQAVEAGAVAVVVTAEPSPELLSLAREKGSCVLRAEGDDPEEFMLRLAGLWRGRNPQWKVVGVTGSVGKTTTKDMLAQGLSARYRTHATAGNFNNLIGLPLTILGAEATDEVVVAEMGMNHKGELSRLTACARPDVAVITNVGTSHIGLLGSRENIARAKAEIIEGMRPSSDGDVTRSLLVMTSDNDFADFIDDGFAKPAGVETQRVGFSPDDDVRAEGLALDEEGLPTLGLVFSDGQSLSVSLNVPGRHVVSDFLLAMAICDRLGVDRRAAALAIATMPQTHMRLEVVTAEGKPRMIDDSYNASPSSIAAALDVLCSMSCEGRRVAILGEVGELGDEAARLHGYIGAYAAAKPLDLLVWVGEKDIRHAVEAARTMGFSEDRLEVVSDVNEALRVIAPILREDDLVLVKASRSAGLDAFVKGVLA